MPRQILRPLAMLLLGVGLLLGYMVVFEDSFIYFPSRSIEATPADYGLPFRTLAFAADDGIVLSGWFIPAVGSRFAVLHMHGNAGNISHRLHLYRRWHDMGLSVFAFDYRGYGASEGTPSEAGLYADGRAAWLELTQRLHVPASRVILAGRSIGGAVAARLATEANAAGLVLETPFTNIPDMARHHYPWLPAALVKSHFDTLRAIARVHMPLLVIEAADDEIVPAGMAARILAAAHEPKRLLRLSGDHNDFDIRSEAEYIAAWQHFLADLQCSGSGLEC